MSGVLIDTNIYALAMRGDPQVVDTLRAISHIGFSVISAGELLSGFNVLAVGFPILSLSAASRVGGAVR